jgi:hypothetical protein
MKSIFIIASLLLTSISAYAQAAGDVIANDQFLMDLINSIGGLKGAGAVAIALVVAQLLIKFLKTPISGALLKKVSPNVVWAITSGLNILAVALGLIASGVSVTAALTHAAVMMPLVNYLYGIYERFIEKK